MVSFTEVENPRGRCGLGGRGREEGREGLGLDQVELETPLSHSRVDAKELCGHGA